MGWLNSIYELHDLNIRNRFDTHRSPNVQFECLQDVPLLKGLENMDDRFIHMKKLTTRNSKTLIGGLHMNPISKCTFFFFCHLEHLLLVRSIYGKGIQSLWTIFVNGFQDR